MSGASTARNLGGAGNSPGLPSGLLTALTMTSAKPAQKTKMKRKYLGLHLPVLVAGIIFFVAIAAGSVYLFSFGGLEELQGLYEAPTGSPTQQLTASPTVPSAVGPTTNPDADTTLQPSSNPTFQPNAAPTNNPSDVPTLQPSGNPTLLPSRNPTSKPSNSPTLRPSRNPSIRPSGSPTFQPSGEPTNQPSLTPTSAPSFNPSTRPSKTPTMQPSSDAPTILQPSLAPTPQAASVSPYVVVTFTSAATTPSAASTAFANAAARWSTILSGTNLSPANIPAGTTFNSFSCNLANNVAIPETFINQLHIAAEIAPIDGAGGILGSAGPCSGFLESLNLAGLFLPVFGRMMFDSADIANLEASGELEDVILHEMGHVLGIGTLWSGMSTLGIPPLVINRIFPTGITDPQPDNTPIYVGTGARAEYVALSGVNEDIPIEDGSFRGLTPAQILAGEGIGSIDGHWKETLFSNELMTPAIGGNVNPLSILSLKALEDIGYVVDSTQADAYSIPAPSKGSGSGVSVAQHTEQTTILKDDIFRCPDLQKGLEMAQNRAKARRRLGGPNHESLLDG